MASTIGILLLTDSADLQRRWAEMLASAQCELWMDPSALADNTPLDVVVTDRPLVSDALAAHGRRLAAGDIGVIAVGCGGPADVSLPADATRRELKLACLLLAQIVKLRRERRENKRIRRVLSHLALSDPLTGLANRRAWHEELARRMARLEAGSGAVCLALVDLDHFKNVNDQLGHSAGDAVLRETARALVASVRSRDFVARLGGDEFALLIAELEPEAAHAIVERIRESLGAWLAKSEGPHLTVSAGFAVATRNESADRVVEAADEALRRAKSEGRNRTIGAGS